MPLRCVLCPATVADTDAAIDAGWYPSFWLDDETEMDGPVCHWCVCGKMTPGPGEPVILPAFRHLLDDAGASAPVVVPAPAP